MMYHGMGKVRAKRRETNFGILAKQLRANCTWVSCETEEQMSGPAGGCEYKVG
jgi:hypothetical protein